MAMNSLVSGRLSTYVMTAGSVPGRFFSSGTKYGLSRKRTSSTRSASMGVPYLKPNDTMRVTIRGAPPDAGPNA